MLAAKPVLVPADFSSEPFISIARATLLRTRIDSFFLSQGIRRQLGPETPSSLIACSLVAAGGGLAIVDPFSAEAAVEPDICFKRLEPRIEVRFSLVVPLNKQPPAPAQDFVTGIQQEFARFHE
jgi:DNA-binding transcriptional LysR family regulator